MQRGVISFCNLNKQTHRHQAQTLMHGNVGTDARTRLIVGLREFINALPWKLFPGVCRFCDQPSGHARDLCDICDSDLPRSVAACRRCALPLARAAATCSRCATQAPNLDRTIAALMYAPPVDALIADVKFHGRLSTAPLLAALLADAVQLGYAKDTLPQAVVPVPLSLRRLMHRGHDQAELLARQTLARLRADARSDGCNPRPTPQLANGLLQRTKHTRPQSGETFAARQRNLTNAFSVPPNAFKASASPPFTHVALVDDVFTTGATLNAAALALRAVGMTRVDAWVVARTPAERQLGD